MKQYPVSGLLLSFKKLPSERLHDVNVFLSESNGNKEIDKKQFGKDDFHVGVLRINESSVIFLFGLPFAIFLNFIETLK